MKELNYEKVFNTLVEETANYVTSNGFESNGIRHQWRN